MSNPPATVTAAPTPEAYAAWQRAVAGVLARSQGVEPADLGENPERELVSRTYDGLTVDALYTGRDELPEQPLPGTVPYVRGSTAARDIGRGWKVCVRHGAGLDAGAANRAASADLQDGAAALWLDLGGDAPAARDLADVLVGVHLDLAPVVLTAGVELPAAVAALAPLLDGVTTGATVDISLGADPYRHHFRSEPGIDTATAVDLAIDAAARPGSVRALVVDGTLSHDAGASDADEVGSAIAAGVALLRELSARGLEPAAALGQVDFRFAATDDQFQAIAKLRAARRLWARVAEVIGAPTAGGMRQHAVTSTAMMTARDPWVNLLRTTVAAFGAGVGGADLVTVLPFDTVVPGGVPGVAPSLGPRLARNTQLLLLEEAHIGRVRDPAGGSWYVEALTTELATTAWAWFQQLESAGGFGAALESGLLAERFAATRERRTNDVAHRVKSVTGVNEFPDLGEAPLPPVPPAALGPLAPTRYAAAFEMLRDRSDAHLAATGARPRVALATLGPVADHNGRATFAANLLASGGIETVRTDAPVAGGPVTEPVVVVCGTAAAYAEHGADVVTTLRDGGAQQVLVAGPPASLPAAVDGALVAGVDAVAVLTALLDRLGVA